jgi:hypothetical protein
VHLSLYLILIIMFPRSLILLASAGAAIAQVAPECEHLTDVTALLNTDDGKAYCSAVRDIGTTTETVVESATATETTTITTPSQVTLSVTNTLTSTVTEGFVTETAATATATDTVTESTTVYSCTTALKRREYGEAQSTSCTKGKTTSTPTPSSTSCTKSKTSSTPTPVVTSTSCTKSEGQQHATSAAYGASQPAYSQGASSIAQEGYYGSDASKAAYPSKAAGGSYSAPLYTDSGAKVYPTAGAGYYQNASSAAYPTMSASSVHYDAYPEASSTAHEEYPITSSIYKQISSLISSYAGYPTVSSSVYYSSEVASSSIYSMSSSIYTPSPTPTPTPTPVPSCEAAPSAVQIGHSCDEVYSACGCLGLASATAHVTTTTTLTEAVFVTEAMLFTTTTQLTETVFTTVPATTTVTPSVTVTTTTTATATVCPCTSSQTLCGSTPDTCKDLQNDANNCGTCGNVCNSGQCSAGKCLDCVPRNCQTFSLGRCNNAGLCYCVTGSTGKPLCGDLSRGNCLSYQKCDSDSNCASGEICTRDTCCNYAGNLGSQGICIPVNNCGNPQSVKRMFQPRGKSANELVGF